MLWSAILHEAIRDFVVESSTVDAEIRSRPGIRDQIYACRVDRKIPANIKNDAKIIPAVVRIFFFAIIGNTVSGLTAMYTKDTEIATTTPSKTARVLPRNNSTTAMKIETMEKK